MSLLDKMRENSPRIKNTKLILKSFNESDKVVIESIIEKARKKLDPNGRWVTIDGRHVHISGSGEVDAGKIYGQDNKDSKDHTTKNGGKNHKTAKEAHEGTSKKEGEKTKVTTENVSKEKVKEALKNPSGISMEDDPKVRQAMKQGVDDILTKLQAKKKKKEASTDKKESTRWKEGPATDEEAMANLKKHGHDMPTNNMIDKEKKRINSMEVGEKHKPLSKEEQEYYQKNKKEIDKITEDDLFVTHKEAVRDHMKDSKKESGGGEKEKFIKDMKDLYKKDRDAYVDKVMGYDGKFPEGLKEVDNWIVKEREKEGKAANKKEEERKAKGILTERGQRLYDNSVEDYKKLSPEKQKEAIAGIKENIAKDKRGRSLIGFGLDEDAIEAGKKFLKEFDKESKDVKSGGEKKEGKKLISQKEIDSRYYSAEGNEVYDTDSFKTKKQAENNRKDIVDYFGSRIISSEVIFGKDDKGNEGYQVKYELKKD